MYSMSKVSMKRIANITSNLPAFERERERESAAMELTKDCLSDDCTAACLHVEHEELPVYRVGGGGGHLECRHGAPQIAVGDGVASHTDHLVEQCHVGGSGVRCLRRRRQRRYNYKQGNLILRQRNGV